MSFILDALKKSEAERARQIGPTLLEVRVAPPPRRYPIWAAAIAALLLINGTLLVYLLRRPSGSESPTVISLPPSPAPSATAAPAPANNAPPVAASPAAPTLVPPDAAARNGVAAPPASDSNGSEEAGNPADNEPAVASAPTSGHVTVQRDTSGGYASLPNASEIGGNLPDLRLDLHVYADKPEDRSALINMHRVREGDVLPEGARVLAITREGVALEYRGQDFMLRPQ